MLVTFMNAQTKCLMDGGQLLLITCGHLKIPRIKLKTTKGCHEVFNNNCAKQGKECSSDKMEESF